MTSDVDSLAGQSPCVEARKLLDRADDLAWTKRRKKAALPKCREAIDLAMGAGCTDIAAQGHWRIGQIHFFARKHDLAAALEEFSEAVRLAPEWAEAHLWQANTLADLGRGEEAVLAYLEAIRREPTDPRIHLSLARCLFDMGRFAEAVSAYREGLRLRPSYGEMSARMLLAEALVANDQIDEALKEWNAVLALKEIWEYERGEHARAHKLIARYTPKIARGQKPVRA